MTEQPAQAPRDPVTAEGAEALRAFATRERTRAEALAAVLEDIAANGLPRAEDCVPWEELRDRRLAELREQRGHVA